MALQLRVVLAVAKTCWPLLLGNLLEWYEFGVYGYLTSEIEANFFRGSKAAVWIGFALIFAARPLGGIVFGFVSDRCGRRLAMNLSGFGMLIATVCQGCLPTYFWGGNELGQLGAVLLCILRSLQGISAGGEIAIVHSYLVEMAPLDMIARVDSLATIGGGLAFLSANAAVAVMAGLLPEQAMIEWGWRVPFILSLPPGLLAVWGRTRFPESELFLKERLGSDLSPSIRQLPGNENPKKLPDMQSSRLDLTVQEVAQQSVCSPASDIHLMKAYWPSIVLGIASPAAGATALYVSSIWCLTYIKSLGVPQDATLIIGMAANIVGLLTTPLFAYLADVHGIAFVMMLCGISMMLTGLPCVALIVAYPGSFWVAFVCIGVCFGSIRGLYTVTFCFCAELLPTKIRSRGLGLGLNIGVTIFGGFGGLIAQWSLSISDLGPGFLMSSTGAITFLAILWSLHLRRLSYPVTHRRAVPYFLAIRGPDGNMKVEAAEPALQLQMHAKRQQATEQSKLMAAAWKRDQAEAAASPLGQAQEP